jgi:hypothetical protein
MEYSPKRVDVIDRAHTNYILWQIGPVWGIEMPTTQDDPSDWRYFDEKGAKDVWDKLKQVKVKK